MEIKSDTETIKKSMEFYNNCDTKKCIRDYALRLAFENKLNLPFEEVIEWFKDNYTNYMKKNFNFTILFAQEISQFAFDEYGNILPLDGIIYQKLRLCAAKCRLLYYEKEICYTLSNNKIN